MAKKLMTLMMILLCGLTWGASSAQAEGKFAFADVDKAMNQSQAAKKARDLLDRSFTNKQKELTSMEGDIKVMMNDLEKRKNLMTPEAQAELQEKIQNKRRELGRLAEDHRATLDRENAMWSKKITRILLSVIQDIGAEEGYTAIFGKGQVIFASPKIDITDRVLERLNTRTQELF
ncbi:MAG: OmpH family outer membrane protein [Magnetococcales bacterium]|nr:OmpH family outer membrane protein [Magnetococcales bacterium]